MDENIPSEHDNLLKKHRKEKKDLQAQIHSMKKSIPKGDKKRKKEVNEDITILEKELEERHKKELSEADALNKMAPNENGTGEKHCASSENSIQEEVLQVQRVSRAQKRRNKKDQDAKEREKRITEQAERNKEGPRHTEMILIKQLLKACNRQIYNIPADGNCLYLAVNHQLEIMGQPTYSISDLRKKTADFMRKNKNDFLPFMFNELDSDDEINEETFEKYCKNVETTKLWGSQLELKALSSIVSCPIKIIQAGSPPTLQGENINGPELVITYHRHLYRLGEHYNSTLTCEGVSS
ncbi:deubiquitinase OTUD6B [Cylas formicarius]|uniref:deubiquitinase OTUD6B n=1 Tax=Cylas formicarius TaxID=197179 RepID=UPI002958B925|nr:deubiquitinase OTUD6B [Cylas formicarius]